MRSVGNVMKTNPALQSRRPKAMMGMEYSKIRRLPMRSTRTRAAQVKKKLVIATDIDVRVGLANPRSVKMVAEKYIREFCLVSVTR